MKADQYLKDQKIVVIKGLPGGGKSTIACKLAGNFSNGNNVLFLHSPNEWSMVPPKRNVLVWIDDMFGKYSTSKADIQEWESILSMIIACVKEGNVKLVITIRLQIFNKLPSYIQNSYLFANERVTDLSSADVCLTIEEKRAILESHLQINNKMLLSDKELQDICSEDTPLGFPQCVHLFTTTQQLFEKKSQFFSNPFEYLEEELEQMLEKDTKDYFVLASIMFLGTNLTRTVDELEKSKLDMFCHFQSLFPFDNPGQDRNDHLEGTYIAWNERTHYYQYAHDSIEEAVTKSFCKHFPNFFIQHCPLELLCYVSSSSKIKDISSSKIPLKFEYLGIIAEKLKLHLQQGLEDDFEIMAELVLWDSEQFCEHFFKRVVDPFKYQDREGNSLLYHSVSVDNLNLLTRLIRLKNAGEQILEMDKGLELLCRLQSASQRAEMYTLLCKFSRKSKQDLLRECGKYGTIDIINDIYYGMSEHDRTMAITEAVCVACQYGRLPFVQHVLHAFPDDLLRDNEYSCSILERSVTGGNVELFRYLVDFFRKSSCLDTQRIKNNRTDFTILHQACAAYTGNLQMVTDVLDTFPDLIDAEDCFWQTPLHCAACSGYIDLMKSLLGRMKGNKTKALSKKTISGKTILHMAALFRKFEMVRYIISEVPSLVNEKDENGVTPLYCAAAGGCCQCVAELLKSAEVLYERKIEGTSILMIAAAYGNDDVVQHLLKYYSFHPRTETNDDGVTLLHIVARECRMPVFDSILTVYKRYPEYIGSETFENSGTALDWLIEKIVKNETEADLKKLAILLNHQVSCKDENIQNLIDYSVNGGLADLTQCLLNNYPQQVFELIIDYHSNGDNGSLEKLMVFCPYILHLCAYHGCDKTVAILVNKGADPCQLNNESQTPLDCAIKGRKLYSRQSLNSKEFTEEQDYDLVVAYLKGLTIE